MNKRNKTKKFRRKIKGGSDHLSPEKLDTKLNGAHVSNVKNGQMSDDLVKLFFKYPFLITNDTQNTTVQMTVNENSVLEDIFTTLLSMMKQPKMSTTDFEIIKDLRLAGFIYEDLTKGFVRSWHTPEGTSGQISAGNFWRGIGRNGIGRGTLSDIEYKNVETLITNRLISNNKLFYIKGDHFDVVMTPEKYAEMLTSDSSDSSN